MLWDALLETSHTITCCVSVLRWCTARPGLETGLICEPSFHFYWGMSKTWTRLLLWQVLPCCNRFCNLFGCWSTGLQCGPQAKALSFCLNPSRVTARVGGIAIYIFSGLFWREGRGAERVYFLREFSRAVKVNGKER